MSPPLRVLSHLALPLLDPIRAHFPHVEVIGIPESGPLPEGVEGEVLLTQAWGAPNLGATLERGVRWVHTFGTGVERFPLELLGDRQLSCARGASAGPIAEWVLAVMLAFEKDLPGQWIEAPPRRWNRAQLGGLRGKTLGCVGFGGIGQAVARLGQAFGMEPIASRRSAGPSPVPGVEMVEPDALFARAQHIVIAAPDTPETHHLVDAERLARLGPGSHLVNVARGGLIDQEALREALETDRVARASLDVCTPEPLPEGHWLYHHPKVRLSAHVSWSAPDAIDGLVESFVRNLERFLEGRPLEGLVDPARGY